jgi:hypothetical protein
MFFTRVYRPYMPVRVVGFLVILIGGSLLWRNGLAWWDGYVVLAIGLLMFLYVRKLVVDETERHLVTLTGIFPFVVKHIHPAHQLRSIKLSVNHAGAKNPETPLRRWPIIRSTVHWNSGRWARMMSGYKMSWIEKRSYSVASALGLNVEMTDGYKRYREKVIGRE